MKTSTKEAVLWAAHGCEYCDGELSHPVGECPADPEAVTARFNPRIAARWTEQGIRDLLMKSGKAVARALVVLHDRQEDDEQASRITSKRNGVGFTAFDAEFLSSLAERVKGGRALTPAQVFHARKALNKYAGQLARIANREG